MANLPKFQKKIKYRKKECNIVKLLNPKNDYVFKRIFGQIGNEDITASLISSIVGKEITNVELDNNTILEKDLFDDKVGILDIKAKINSAINNITKIPIIPNRILKFEFFSFFSSDSI